MAVNELRYLQLKEIKYGVELDVPAATILSIFGFRAQICVQQSILNTKFASCAPLAASL
ncbi:hypothetical protein FS837_006847 [Tulasnella sp. UAMH 9824]|nr:hypothetical protein FS837_006847 [Tulasnella sp. UAMH 9824]